MDVITTHVNADFDALGAMVAAKKLYPEAVVVFPGSREKTVRQFFVASSFYAMDVHRARDVELSEVRRLILVDVAQAQRIGRFSALVGRPDVEVHLYDHHPPGPNDIVAKVSRIELVGSATTVLVEILQERRIPIAPDEATLMILGVYEDTGSLTFASTTPRDLLAAAYLLSQGADLNAVSAFLTPELTSEQIALLDDLLRNRTVHRVHGIDVTVAEAARENYVGDLAVLVHKMKDMENLDAVVALARMEDRTYLVARSRIPEVDVSVLAKAFGGGGHREASSATIRDLTPIQVRERVLELLPSAVFPRTTARDLWTTPVKTVEAGTSLAEAGELLNRYHINAMPVMKGERIVGLVTRQLVGRTLQHGLLSVPVEEYMTTEFATVGPDAPLGEIQARIIRGNQRFLPVVEKGKLVGAVTRTDLLRALHGPEQTESVELARGTQDRNARTLLAERLQPDVYERVVEIGQASADLGMEAYLVGGLVRDVFLRRKNLDVDVVVEGDAVMLAGVLAEHWGAAVRAHEAFRTATVIFRDGFRIDLATARTEYYAQPAALPAVERSSLKLDLYRRDFTINTLALRLQPARFGEVIDFFGGLRDVKEGTIRILHNLSFVEDPTRVLRALRFQVRFGFRLGRQTQKLLRSAVAAGFVAQARGKRLLQEWLALLKEGDPVEALEALEEHSILGSFHPSLQLDGRTRELLDRVRDVITWFQLLYLEAPLQTPFMYLLAVFDRLSDDEIAEWAASFGVRDREGRQLLSARRQAYRALSELQAQLHEGEPRDSRTYEILHRLDQEVRLFVMAKTRDEEKRKLVSRYYTRLEGVRPVLRGRDLRALGIPAGPVYRTLLEGLRRAKLDGEVKTREDEVRWVTERYQACRSAEARPDPG